MTDRLRLRLVKKDDCLDVWRWRNHPLVRNRSFDRRFIGYADHKRWFQEQLKNKDIVFYIALNSRGEKLGQVRLESLKNNKAIIHINLNPRFIGKGRGWKIIKMAVMKFTKANIDVDEIQAKILAGNTASEKAFEKGGFSFFKDSIKGRKKIKTYRFLK